MIGTLSVDEWHLIMITDSGVYRHLKMNTEATNDILLKLRQAEQNCEFVFTVYTCPAVCAAGRGYVGYS